MKVKKRIAIALSLIIVVICISALVIHVKNRDAIVNAFDEMIYACSQEVELPWGGTIPNIFSPATDASFTYVSSVHGSRVTTMLFYNESYLRENEKLTIMPGVNVGNITFFFTLTRGEDKLYIIFNYSVDNKVLTCDPLEVLYKDSDTPSTSDDDIIRFMTEHQISVCDVDALKHYIIEEKILADWFKRNQERSAYSLESVGNYSYIDSSYSATVASFPTFPDGVHFNE